jgi:hypothetical protein
MFILHAAIRCAYLSSSVDEAQQRQIKRSYVDKTDWTIDVAVAYGRVTATVV